MGTSAGSGPAPVRGGRDARGAEPDRRSGPGPVDGLGPARRPGSVRLGPVAVEFPAVAPAGVRHSVAGALIVAGEAGPASGGTGFAVAALRPEGDDGRPARRAPHQA
ncbi:hypothetical protein [Streptomyces griseus]|uniref:hypothetical protein n=1 Tax=Streptomyces griseus TaxID=1911 RepID=UPI0038157959